MMKLGGGESWLWLVFHFISGLRLSRLKFAFNEFKKSCKDKSNGTSAGRPRMEYAGTHENEKQDKNCKLIEKSDFPHFLRS